MANDNPKDHFNVTAGIIFKDGKVLITKRPEGTHLAGIWEFPGGKKEAGETLQMCVEREIKEELDMEVRAEECLLTVQHEYRSKKITLHVFRCEHLKGSPNSMEGQEIKWARPPDLENYSFPPPDQKIIDFINSKYFIGRRY